MKMGVAGVDIGRRELRVCARVPDEVSGESSEIIESWGTTTPDLLNLVVWLRGLGVTHVVMEATSVIRGSNKFLLRFSRSWPLRTRP
jgi:hypothetical protein